MKQSTIISVVITLLSLWLPANHAFGQPAAATPTVSLQSQCDVINAPNQVDAYQAVLDFAPNQWSATHTHAGPVCVSMLAGDITFRYDAKLLTVPASQSYLEDSLVPHAVGNTTTTAARMLVTNLTPRGQLQYASGAASANPGVRTSNIMNEIDDLPGQLTIVHLVLDFAPGAATPMQIHGGWALHTVLTGELSLQEKGAPKTVKTGDGWAEGPALPYALVNSGAGNARLFESVLLPKGATLTTDQVAAPGTSQELSALWLLIGAAIIALVVGRLILRKSRRT